MQQESSPSFALQHKEGPLEKWEQSCILSTPTPAWSVRICSAEVQKELCVLQLNQQENGELEVRGRDVVICRL